MINVNDTNSRDVFSIHFLDLICRIRLSARLSVYLFVSVSPWSGFATSRSEGKIV